MRDITTPRLNLRRFAESDAPFTLALLNDPGWLQFIGDKGVRTLDDARAYLRNGPITIYARFGLGLPAVDLKDGGQTIGMRLERTVTLPDSAEELLLFVSGAPPA